MDNNGGGGLIAAVQLSDHGEADQPDPLYISKDDLDGMTWRHFSILLKSLFAAPPDAVRVKYMDDDGDWVELGSDAELSEAFRCSGGSGEILQLRVRRVDNDLQVVPPAVSAPPSVDEQTDASQYSNSDPSREGLPYNYTDLGVNGREVDNPFMMYIPTTESASHGTGHLQYPHTNEVQAQTPAQAHTQPQPLVYPYPGVIAAPILPKAPKIPTILYNEETKRPVHWMPFGDFNQLDTKVIWDEAARYGMEEKIAFLKQLAEKEAGRRSQTSKQDPFETDEESVHNASQPQSSDILIPTQVSTQSGSGNWLRSSSCEPSGLDATMQNQDLAATAQPSPRRSLSREKSVFSQGATNTLYSSAVVPQTKLAKKVDNSSATPVPMPRSLLMMEGAQSGANAVAIEMPESEAYHGASFNKEEEIAASGGASSTSASEETGEIMSLGGGSAGMTPEVKTASMQADCGVAVSSPSVAGNENIEPVTQVSKSQHKMQQKKLLTAARDKKKLDATSSNIEAMKPETYGVGARPKVVEKKIKKKSDSSAPRLKTPEKSDKKKGKVGEKEAMKDEESGETAVAQGQPKKDKSTLHLEDFLKHMKKVKKDLRENIVNDVTKTTARLLKKNLSRSVSLNEKTHADTLTVHKGITCDYCDQEIVGVRYKCGNCSDFDLCQKCEASEHGHEATHVFLKMLRPSRKAGCVGKSRFPLLKENIYLAEKARQEKMMKKIEQQKAADLEKWLNEDLTTKGQLEKVSEILERSVTQTVVTVVADTEVKATEAQQEPQQKLSRRGSDTSGSSIVRLSPPLPVIIRQPDEAKVSREWTQDAAMNESVAEPSVAEETVNNITNLEASMENSNALDDACSLASGSSYEYFPSDDSEEFCILTPPAREEYERIGTEENEEVVEVACEPPSYQEVEQQQMTESLQSVQQELPTKEGSQALQVDPVLTQSPEVNPEYPAEVENHGLGELVHTLTDQEKRIYEVMLNAELSKAIQEEKRVKEAKKDSEKKGKKELLRRHLEEERELTKESSPKPTKQEEDYAEILTIKAMQASLVNRQLEHTDDVTVTEGEVKGQELRSLEAVSVEQEPTVQVRDNTAIYKTMRDDHMAQMLELEVEKFSALDAGDLEAVNRIEHSLKQLDMAAPMMQDAAKNVASQEATTPLLARQASSVSTSTSASECVDAQVTTSDPSVTTSDPSVKDAQVTTSDPSVKDADCQTTPESVGQASHLIHNVAQGVHKAASSAYMTAKDVFFSLQAKQNEKKNAAAVDAAGQVLWSPPSSTWMPKESTWVPLKKEWAPPKSAWTPPTSDYKPPSSSYSPQYDDYTPPQSQWLPPQDVWLPPVEVISEATLQAICKLDAAREQSTKTDKTVTSANKKSDEETVPKRLSMSSVSSVSSTASQGPAPIASLNIADSALRKEIQGMQHLIEMGFANREKNRALLAKHDGDLELVVGSLLQEEGEGHWALDRH